MHQFFTDRKYIIQHVQHGSASVSSSSVSLTRSFVVVQTYYALMEEVVGGSPLGAPLAISARTPLKS
jgi:hypothetical protein